LLDTFARDCSSTNMNLEGMLSQVKASVPCPRKRAGRDAERLAYSGILTQLLAQHAGKGHVDSRGPDKKARAEMRKEGMLHQRPRPEARLHQASNRGDPEAGGDDDDDGSFNLRLDSDAWPVSEECLRTFLTANCGTARLHGVARVASDARVRERTDVLVKDSGVIPEGKKYTFLHSCESRHFGVCVSDDAEHYDRIAPLARSLEQHFSKNLLGRFAFIVDQDQARRYNFLGPFLGGGASGPFSLPSPLEREVREGGWAEGGGKGRGPRTIVVSTRTWASSYTLGTCAPASGMHN